MLGTALTQYFRLRDPSQLIKSAWIRPEDIRHYEEIGIHDFKLSGRTKTVAWILKCMRAYAKRSFKGNLLDILDCPQMLRYVFHIENEKLEGCIEQWKHCKKICDECGYCNKIAENIIIRKY